MRSEFPISLNAGLSRIFWHNAELDFRGLLIARPGNWSAISKNNSAALFDVLRNYTTFATVARSDPIGGRKVFSLSPAIDVPLPLVARKA